MITTGNIKFAAEACYEIYAQGTNNIESCDAFGDMVAECNQITENHFNLKLVGLSSGQTELLGILTKINELHYSLISVHLII